MPLTKEKIKEIISKYGKHERDSGSPEVQIALLTERIKIFSFVSGIMFILLSICLTF